MSLRPEIEGRLRDLQEAAGCGSMGATVGHMIDLLCQIGDTARQVKAEQPAPPQHQQISSEIREMFADYSQGEPVPEPGHAPTNRRRRNGKG